MKSSSFLHRAALAALPATLLFAACSKSDTPAPAPAVDQGKILVSHAAAAANTQLTAFANDQQLGQLNYGQSTGYVAVNAGVPMIRINNGTQVASTQALTVAKAQNYSAFIYSPSATIGSTALLTVADDLSAPTSGAKVRLVYLAAGAATPVRLTIPAPTTTGTDTDLTSDVAFGTASAFAQVNAGPLNLKIVNVTTGPPPTNTVVRTQVLAVGDGSGGGTGTKNFEAGKIYTIVVRGLAGAGVPTAQQPQAVIIQNN